MTTLARRNMRDFDRVIAARRKKNAPNSNVPPSVFALGWKHIHLTGTPIANLKVAPRPLPQTGRSAPSSATSPRPPSTTTSGPTAPSRNRGESCSTPEQPCRVAYLYAERPNMLDAIGQFETEMRAERQMDGIVKAKENGVRFGRKRVLSDEQIEELRWARANGTLIRELMAEHRLSKASVYRYLAEKPTTNA